MARRFLVTAMLGLVCCSGDHGGDPGGHGGATGASSATGASTGQGGGSQCAIAQGSDPVDVFCKTVTTPLCEAVFSCCHDPLVLKNYFGGTLDVCKAQWGAACYEEYQNQQHIGYFLSMGRTALDESALSECVCTLNELAKGGTSCTMSPRWYLKLNCVTAFKGQAPLGASCIADPDTFFECKGGKCVNGTCVPFGNIGDPCVISGDCNLSEGQTCIFNGGTGTCGPRRNIGESCTPGDSFECWSRACDTNSVCIAASAEGLCRDN